MRSTSETVVVEKIDDVITDKDKEKKKTKRRSNRRSKQNSPNLLVNGGELQQSCGNGGSSKSKNFTTLNGYFPSPRRQPDYDDNQSAIAFNSLPTMHINEHVESLLRPSVNGQVFSNSCPEQVVGVGVFAFDGNCSSRSKVFAPHWSNEAVNDALEKGDVFKALFRVNAHNRSEAYCKIEGVTTDVLINGTPAQNRAVDGDIVVIKVDPLVCWTRMKGSNGTSSCNPVVEGCVSAVESNEISTDNCKGSQHFQSEGKNEAANGVDRLSTIISSHPSRRPTGRVVSIVERSSRRNSVVGFLDMKQWVFYQEGHQKDSKNGNFSSNSAHEYIQLIPTDPKFPKMMVLVGGLPDSIKRRLEQGDTTVEMELVAAQIDHWDEESPFPQAHVSHIFGRGSEMESRISAILHENAICCSEFSPESLSCLPHEPWEIPAEELERRTDLRNLCIFTIDPSTATDLDDALSVETMPNGTLRVGVHIADASYFVLPDTALDLEAQIRSTSVYMLRQKLPMLPPRLSENLGSLNPGLDRLAFSIFWAFSSSGNVIDRWIDHTVIHSCCKLSYEHAQDMIDKLITGDAGNAFGSGLPQLHGPFEWSDVIRSVNNLNELSKILRQKRFNDGALQLESSKISFLFDEDGIPYDSTLCERKDSHFLVEEFMLLANRTAAEIISRAFPESALLRRHPEPNMRKLREFESFCCKHGLELDTSSSGDIHRSLKIIEEKLKDDRVLYDILMSYAARPMQLATYFCTGVMKDNINDWGHYALAVPLYTHFTSPLRRYPDIIVHRTLSAAIGAEKLYMEKIRILPNMVGEKETRCFSGINFNKTAAASVECREALSVAASKHKILCTESLADVAAYCNERKLAGRYVKDACDKLYMWAMLKKKKVLSEARVLALGPKFMSIYIQKLGIERRIYYDEIEGLTVEWLEATSTLVLSLCSYKRATRKFGSGFCRNLSDFALVASPCSLNVESCVVGGDAKECICSDDKDCVTSQHVGPISDSGIDPIVFPVTVHLLSTIPVALHAVGGDDGPIDIGVRLYASSYFSEFLT